MNFYNIHKIIITTNSEKYLPFPSHLHSAQAISFREGVGGLPPYNKASCSFAVTEGQTDDIGRTLL